MEIIKDKPDDFQVISGDDLNTLPVLAIGGSGVISVIANAFPQLFAEMVSFGLKYKFKEAQQINYKLLEIMKLLFTEGNPAGIKAILSCLKLMQNNLRLPLTPVSKPLYLKINDAIKLINKD